MSQKYIYFTVFFILSIAIQEIGFSKPFWTSKASWEEGDRVYFVGIASNVESREIGREDAFKHALVEIQNRFNFINSDLIEVKTKMNYEEKLEGGELNVYRLVWINRNDLKEALARANEIKRGLREAELIALQQELAKEKKLSMSYKEDISSLRKTISTNEKLIEDSKALTRLSIQQERKLRQIRDQISARSNMVEDIPCGMSSKQIMEIFGKPDNQIECTGKTNMRYGGYWIILRHDSVSCLKPAKSFSKCYYDNCSIGSKSCENLLVVEP